MGIKGIKGDVAIILARIKIMQSPAPLIELAEELGYTSEAAFSWAYKGSAVEAWESDQRLN